jgi:7,8-dihydropterin-6-yl-methyl-4-(beta-D-ribofuranosyl)aminobenzene 5'-phosphate synthase
MLKAIEMINGAKKLKAAHVDAGHSSPDLTVDLHPDRPAYRGFNFGPQQISLPADPSFDDIERAGGLVSRDSEAHTVLDNMFLVSGYIPGSAPYEAGLKNGIRFIEETGKWAKDEEMADERFLMCNLKGD